MGRLITGACKQKVEFGKKCKVVFYVSFNGHRKAELANGHVPSL